MKPIKNIDQDILDDIEKKLYIIAEEDKDKVIDYLESIIKNNQIIIDLQQEVIKEKDQLINLLKKHYGKNKLFRKTKRLSRSI